MKKLNNKGFVLAETLIVTVFVLVIFSMIYANYYPLIGLYEERETYDDVDGKYVAYWVKKLVESDAYYISPTSNEGEYLNTLGYIKFECSDLDDTNNSRSMCKKLVKSLEISNCDDNGDNCDIYLTHYRIGGSTVTNLKPDFKKTVNGTYYKLNGTRVDHVLRHYDEIDKCALSDPRYTRTNCRTKALKKCCNGHGVGSVCEGATIGENSITLQNSKLSAATDTQKEKAKYCAKYVDSKVFPSYVADYINYLPDFTKSNTSTNAGYRVIVVVNHKKARNNYYSFSTMEVVKND